MIYIGDYIITLPTCHQANNAMQFEYSSLSSFVFWADACFSFPINSCKVHWLLVDTKYRSESWRFDCEGLDWHEEYSLEYIFAVRSVLGYGPLSILKYLHFFSSFLRGCAGDPVQAWEWRPLLPLRVYARTLRWGRPPSLAATDPGSQVRKELFQPLNPIFAVQRSQWNVPRAHSVGLQGGCKTGGRRDWVRPRNNKGQAILVFDMLIWLRRRLGFFSGRRVVIYYFRRGTYWPTTF